MVMITVHIKNNSQDWILLLQWNCTLLILVKLNELIPEPILNVCEQVKLCAFDVTCDHEMLQMKSEFVKNFVTYIYIKVLSVLPIETQQIPQAMCICSIKDIKQHGIILQ